MTPTAVFGTYKLTFNNGDETETIIALLVWDDHQFHFMNINDGGYISDCPSEIEVNDD